MKEDSEKLSQELAKLKIQYQETTQELQKTLEVYQKLKFTQEEDQKNEATTIKILQE